MDDGDLLDLLDATPADELDDVLSGLSPRQLLKVSDWLTDVAPPSTATYVDAAHPAQLAERIMPGWRNRQHLDLLSKKFAEWAKGGGRGIVNIPPQFGKSSLVARWGPTWYLDRWPGRSVIMTSYSEKLIRARSREVRDTFATAEGLHTSVRRGAATQTQWETVDGGGLVAAGIRGTVTGHGANLFVIDDPFANFEEAHSPAVRQHVWDFWRSVATTRLAPNATVVVCQTRWHEDDLTGRLLSDEHEGDPARWDLIRIPALSEGDGDPLGRDEGVPLLRPDEDQTAEQAATFLDDSRTDAGSYVWAGMFQQRPSTPEGTIFERSWWPYFRTAPAGVDQAPPQPDGHIWVDGDTYAVAEMDKIASWDMSFKDAKDTSYVVGQVWGVHPSRRADRFLLAQTRDRRSFTATERAVKWLAKRWRDATPILVEEKANGPAVIDKLNRTVAGLTPYEPRGSKESRAWAVQGDVEAGNVWLPSPAACGWVSQFVDELADFPNAAHDDQVDATTQALDRLRRRGKTKVSAPSSRMIPGVRRR